MEASDRRRVSLITIRTRPTVVDELTLVVVLCRGVRWIETELVSRTAYELQQLRLYLLHLLSRRAIRFGWLCWLCWLR